MKALPAGGQRGRSEGNHEVRESLRHGRRGGRPGGRRRARGNRGGIPAPRGAPQAGIAVRSCDPAARPAQAAHREPGDVRSGCGGQQQADVRPAARGMALPQGGRGGRSLRNRGFAAGRGQVEQRQHPILGRDADQPPHLGQQRTGPHAARARHGAAHAGQRSAQDAQPARQAARREVRSRVHGRGGPEEPAGRRAALRASAAGCG